MQGVISICYALLGEPYPINVISKREGTSPFQYTLQWELPRTGGLAIIEYEFKLRQV